MVEPAEKKKGRGRATKGLAGQNGQQKGGEKQSLRGAALRI
jgi:hypothetical protein